MTRSLVTLAMVAWASAAAAAAAAQDLHPQIGFLRAQLERARERAGAISFRATEEGQDTFGELGPRQFSGSWEVIERGTLRAATRKSEMHFLDGRTPDDAHTTRAVLGPTYHAHRWNDANAADQYLYDAPENMPRRSRDQMRMFNGMSIFNYGFGDGDLPFSAPYLHNPKLSRWEVREVAGSAGGVRYECRRYLADAGADAPPQSLWEFDPGRGGLITRVVKYNAKGEATSELSVDVAEPSPGVYLPVRTTSTLYAGKNAAGEAVVHSRRTITFTDVEPNATVPDSTFTLAYLGLTDGGIVQQVGPDGQAKPMIYAGKLVLEPQIGSKMLKTDAAVWSALEDGGGGATPAAAAKPPAPAFSPPPAPTGIAPQVAQGGGGMPPAWLVGALGAAFAGCIALGLAMRARHRRRQPAGR